MGLMGVGLVRGGSRGWGRWVVGGLGAAWAGWGVLGWWGEGEGTWLSGVGWRGWELVVGWVE